MSTSRHPIALRLEGLVGGDAKLLATVMALPLLDGIFPALVLAGALEETAGPFPLVGELPVGVVQVGLLVFGGSATVAVVLAEMKGSRSERIRTILAVGTVLTLGAAFEAAIAPTLASVLDIPRFERFAALVIVAIAAKTASARIGEYLPRPAVIVGAGLIASIQVSNPTVAPIDEETIRLVWLAAGSAAVGTAFALLTALLAPHLRSRMAIDRFRFGSAVALGLLALSILKLPVGSAPLLVVAVTALFAFEPDGDADADADDDPVEEAEDRPDDPTQTEDPVQDSPAAVADRAATDGGDDATSSDGDGAGDDTAESSGDDENDGADGDDDPLDVDREPWL